MSDSPKRAFETEHDIMGFEFESGSLLFLKPSEKVERGRAYIFEKDDTGGCEIPLAYGLANREGSLVFVNSEDFDDYLNEHNIDDPTRSD